ncbi:WXG100 family type VII secretion target [Streptomyces sp. E5N91]|uniref:WXG100 family type VII secretion target n=1 Tax=Streptomyces sp. E5N91 TaxID=1851996 RepID=UPI000EF60729|nr:WXG100 family type VII secretion target [Streptomyces sp. E5N91]
MSSPFEDGVIHVDYAHIDNAVDNMVQQTKAIDQTLTNLDAELNVLKESWQGDDKSSYAVCQANWNQAVTDMENLLASYIEVLNGAQQNYRYTEQKLSQMWDSVKVQA